MCRKESCQSLISLRSTVWILRLYFWEATSTTNNTILFNAMRPWLLQVTATWKISHIGPRSMKKFQTRVLRPPEQSLAKPTRRYET